MPYKFTPVDHNPWEGAAGAPDWAGMIDAAKDKLATDKSYAAAAAVDDRRDRAPVPEGYWAGVARRATEVGQERLATAVDRLSAPGDVLFGKRSMTPEQVQEYGAGLGGYVMLGGLGRAALAGEVPAADTLGIIAGRSSRTADLDALTARDRFSDPRNVGAWRQTGWWRGAEEPGLGGLPRYEIPDYASTLNPKVVDWLARNPGEEVASGEILNHPQAYKAYPQLEAMPIRHEPGLQHGGYYDPMDQSIALSDVTLVHPTLKSIMLHEWQHAVQDREGFPMGADPTGFWDTNLTKSVEAAKAKAWDSYKKLTGPEAKLMTPEEITAHNDYIKRFNEIHAKFKDLDKFAKTAYKYSGGENEAVAVQNRMNLKPNELGVSLPWESGKVPYSKQLLVPSWTAPGYQRGPGGWGPARPTPIEELLGQAPGGKGPAAPEDVAKSTAAAESTPSAAASPPPAQIERLVEDAKAKDWTVDRTHDVPYGAGSAADSGKTYIDRRIPSKMTVGGKSFDPAEFLKVHEQVEHELMTKGGLRYEHAHRYATAEERAAVEAKGLDWRKYEKAMEKWLDVTEEERADQRLPKDLYTKPYSHSDLRKFKGPRK